MLAPIGSPRYVKGKQPSAQPVLLAIDEISSLVTPMPKMLDIWIFILSPEARYDRLFIQLVAPSSPDYVPRPEHPPSPDYPLPADASPIAASPDYVVDSDPEEDPEEDPEDDQADYPADGGDGDDEPTDDDDDDDTDDEDPKEGPFEEDDEDEEEHPAPENN
nr:hypothetical protein [Tanacetum cinerariifolium]